MLRAGLGCYRAQPAIALVARRLRHTSSSLFGSRLPARRSQKVQVLSPALVRSASAGSPVRGDEDEDASIGQGGSRGKVGWLHRDASVADPSFSNRWAIMVPAFATHLCIGTGWAWGAVADTITRESGFVAAASADWSLTETVAPMPVLFTFFGLTSAATGQWQARVGERKALLLGAACFGGGLMTGAAGIAAHSLPLLTLGYGVMAGVGVGLCYPPPIQVLMGWFPDMKGVAMGTLVAGFGGGALAFVPAWNALTKYFCRPPTFIGGVDEVTTTTRDGVLFADVGAGGAGGGGGGGELIEAVQATAADIARLTLPDDIVLREGFYAVGTGTSGAAEALCVSGAGIALVMAAAAMSMRRPAPGWLPDGYSKEDAAAAAAAAADTPSLSVPQVMRTSQFYKLGIVMTCLTTGTYGLFSVAKGMMAEVFTGSLPALVTASFTSSYLMTLSVANLSGRFVMATLSDRIGCRNTFHLICAGLLPLYLVAPGLVAQVVETGAEMPLYGFCATTFAAVFLACGVISTMPAYEATLFGTKNVGAVHGRMLIFNSIAAVAGPMLFIKLRNVAESDALTSMLPLADPDRFEGMYGVEPTVGATKALVEAKTLTIGKLMELVPEESGAVDPTPYLYDSTMQVMAGLVVVAAISHSAISPVDAQRFQSESASDVVGHGEQEVVLDAETKAKSPSPS